MPDSSSTPRHIYIRKGVYKEKIYHRKTNIIFEGEDREKTIITQAIARDEWRCMHNDDWGVATMNVDANDITLKNLTVTNSFGFDFKAEKHLIVRRIRSAQQKKIGKNGHQMALRTMNGQPVESGQLPFQIIWWRYGEPMGMSRMACGISKIVSWKVVLIFIVRVDGPGRRIVNLLHIPVLQLSGMMDQQNRIQKQFW